MKHNSSRKLENCGVDFYTTITKLDILSTCDEFLEAISKQVMLDSKAEKKHCLSWCLRMILM